MQPIEIRCADFTQADRVWQMLLTVDDSLFEPTQILVNNTVITTVTREPAAA
jgi:hypothetical protein